MSRHRVLFTLVPLVLLIVLLEGLLSLPWIRDRVGVGQSLGGFGSGGSLFVPVSLPGGEQGLGVRPDALRTFHSATMLARKPAGAARIFCLGESSAYGYPWGEEAAFPKGIERRIRALVPDLPVEVLNLGAMSYGSLRIRNLVEELVRYEPDLLVLYVGHNEFVEEEVYREILSRAGWLAEAARELTRLRTYALLQMGARQILGEPEQRTLLFGLEDVEGFRVERAERRLFTLEEKEAVAAAFRRNIERIVQTAEKHGVKVLLSTMPSNLGDWRPEHLAFAYALDPGRRTRLLRTMTAGRILLENYSAGDALPVLEEALAIESRYAPLQYLIARCYDAKGNTEEAKRHFVLARDLDPVPIRALSAVNEAIRSIARTHPSVLFVDAEMDFAGASPHGIIGSNLILDYCHPNPAGHARIANSVVRALAAGGVLVPPERWRVERLEGLSLPEESPRPLSTEPSPVLWWLGVVAKRQGNDAVAIERFEQSVARDETFAPGWKQLASLDLKSGDLAGARLSLENAARIDPSDLETALELAVLRRREGDVRGSVEALERLVRIDPRNPDLWTRLGESEHAAGEFERAAGSFREAIRLAPDQYAAYLGLGAALKERGRKAQAREALRKAIEIARYSPAAEEMLRSLEAEDTPPAKAAPLSPPSR